MLNNESNIDKKVKYGFKRNLIGSERPNLFVNLKGTQKINNREPVKIIKEESFISPSSDKSFTPILSTKINYNMNTDVYIINNVHGGGTLKYKKDIKAKYTNINFIEVPDKQTLESIKFNANNILFVQQLLFSDLAPRDILNIKCKKT